MECRRASRAALSILQAKSLLLLVEHQVSIGGSSYLFSLWSSWYTVVLFSFPRFPLPFPLQVYEHPQNTMLVKVLNANLEIQRLGERACQPATGLSALMLLSVQAWLLKYVLYRASLNTLTNKPHPWSAAAETDQDGEPLDITDGRMLRTWLEMQNSVNAFIDSTTAENEPNAIVRV